MRLATKQGPVDEGYPLPEIEECGSPFADPYLAETSPVRLSGMFDCMRDIRIGRDMRSCRFALNSSPELGTMAGFVLPSVLIDALLRLATIAPPGGGHDVFVSAHGGKLRLLAGLNDLRLAQSRGPVSAPVYVPPVTIAAPAPAQPAEPALAAMANPLEAVLRVFADVTRYPLEILDPQADLETDLGVDSVKLGEIFAVLREQFGLPAADVLREQWPAEAMRTIAGISSAMGSLRQAPAPVLEHALTPVPSVMQPPLPQVATSRHSRGDRPFEGRNAAVKQHAKVSRFWG